MVIQRIIDRRAEAPTKLQWARCTGSADARGDRATARGSPDRFRYPSCLPHRRRFRANGCRKSALRDPGAFRFRFSLILGLEQRTVEPVVKPAGLIDNMNLKAFLQPRLDPGHKFRGSKTSRWAWRSVVVLSDHHELLPVNVKSELEQRAALVYPQSSHRGRDGHTVRNGVLFPLIL
jgi:hypothetical protein